MAVLSDETIEWLRTHTMSCNESEFQSALNELVERRSLDSVRRAEINELVERRLNDLDPEDLEAIRWAHDFINDNTESHDGAAGRALGLFLRLISQAGK